jgi:hypothetical protein
MKRIFVLWTFICLATICACQKQDSAAEAQLAQRKAELDTREKALDEREKAVVEREKATTRFRAIPSDLQSRRPTVDPEQMKAERQKRIQQLRLEEARRKKMGVIASPTAGSSDIQSSSPSPSPTP